MTLAFSGGEGETRIPPTSWNPISASDEDLAFYWVPARPSTPEGLATWNAQWQNYKGFLAPVACQDAGTGNIEAQIATDPLTGAVNSNNWAGVVANAATNYTKALGNFTQTTPVLCPGAGVSSHVQWVGLGGYNTGRLLQNGTAQDGAANGTRAWYEGLTPTVDTGEITLANFTVRSGDAMTTATTYVPSDGHVGFFFNNATLGVVSNLGHVTMPVFNRTTGAAAGNAAVTTMYDGTSAEAIDERSYSYGTRTLDQLRRFNAAYWSETSSSVGGSSTRTALRAQTHVGLDMVQGSTSHILASHNGSSNILDLTDTWRECGVNGL